MIVLIYCDDPGCGGTAVNAALLANGLMQEGFEIFLASSKDITHGRIDFFEIGYDTQKMTMKSAYSRSEPERILLTVQPDLVFFCDGSPDANLAAKLVCCDWNVPYIAMVNYVAREQINSMGELKAKTIRTLSMAQAVVAMSNENLQLLRENLGVPPERLGVIFNGRPAYWFEHVAPEKRAILRQELGLDVHDVLFLTVARYEPRKGYQHLIVAIQALSQIALPTRPVFAWIGQSVDDSEDKLRATVAAMGLNDQVLVVGERNDLRDWLMAADAFILPSESEGMPLCIIEAMGQGLPIVATSVSGIPEEVGDAGILIPDPRDDAKGTINALIQAIVALTTSPEQRRFHGEAGRQRAQAYFTAEGMVGNYIGLLRSLIPNISAVHPSYPNPVSYQPPNRIVAGQDILMGDDASSIEFILEGWSHAEGTGRWTDGDRARIVLSLPQELSNGFVLVFEATPFLGRGNKILTTTLMVNSRNMGCTIWNGASKMRRVEVAVMPSMPSKLAELVWVVSGASSPASHGLSDDQRLLGLQVSRLRLECLK